MSVQAALAAGAPYVLRTDEGDHHHFLNHLATVKVAGGIHSALSVVEFAAPRGFGPPLHQHHDEDELFVILEGEVTLFRGEETIEAPQGSTVFLPRGVPHGFQVVSDFGRISTITASVHGRPEFDRMVTEIGTPTDRPTLPTPGPIDPDRVAEICAKYHIEILGPPPAPLN